MRAPRYAETVTGKLRHIGENDMTRLLASLFIATSLLAVASSEASAWVCLAAGAGSSAYGRDYSHPDSWGIWSNRCTRCRAAAATSPSETSSAGSISDCHLARTWPST